MKISFKSKYLSKKDIMYKFSKRSLRRLKTCHEDLQTIMKEVIKVTDIDFGITEGHRSKKTQFKYFKKGRKLINCEWKIIDQSKIITYIDGYKKIGKHNYKPSLAVDVYIYYDKKAQWDSDHLNYFAGIVRGVSEMLLKEGKINHKIRWGGNFDMDGQILEQSFDDRPHFELINS